MTLPKHKSGKSSKFWRKILRKTYREIGIKRPISYYYRMLDKYGSADKIVYYTLIKSK